MDYESIIVVLAAGGTGGQGAAPLERDALNALAGTAVTWVRIEREGDVACLAARVRHADPPAEFGDRVRRWGAARGWAVTVAPSGPRR